MKARNAASVLFPQRADVPSWIWVLCAFAFWLNANPYIGINHDARLYMLMAYRWLRPEAFAHDPWFAFGSQDDYSIFSPLLGALISMVGVSTGAIVATVLQGLAFAWGCVALARAGMEREAYPLVALCLVSFAMLYSPNSMLYVTEGFVTARGFAIPLSLCGFACAASGRRTLALCLHGAAFLLHPIMAVVPAAVSILVLSPPRIRPWLLVGAWGAYVLLLLAALGGYLPVVEGEWRYFLQPAPLIFIDPWLKDVIAPLTFWGAVLWAGARMGALPLRAIYLYVLLVAASGVCFSLLATVVPWTTALQAQLWRGLWIMKLMAVGAAADLLWRFVLLDQYAIRRTMALAAVIVAFLGTIQPLLAACALMAIVTWHSSLTRVEPWLAHRRTIFIGLLAFLVLLASPALIFELADRSADIDVRGFGSEVWHGLWRNAGLGLVAIVVWRVGAFIPVRRFALVAVAMVVAASVFWDGRKDEQKAREANYSIDGHLSHFASLVPPGATVSWYKETERVWFELGRASYAGSIHATGLVFSQRRTSLLADRLSRVILASQSRPSDEANPELVRRAALAVAAKAAFFRADILSSYEEAGQPTAAGLRWLCQDPALDFVIDSTRLPESIGETRDRNGKNWYLYRCKRIAPGRSAIKSADALPRK